MKWLEKLKEWWKVYRTWGVTPWQHEQNLRDLEDVDEAARKAREEWLRDHPGMQWPPPRL